MAKDDRVTMKIDRALWDSMSALIKAHPEWGILSVPEFVRRAIDNEMRSRIEAKDHEVVHLPVRARPR